VKLRRSTAILAAVWIVTFVVYVFVKPDTQDHSGFAPIANTLQKTVIAPASPH
jgi:hypothetical protein